MLTREWSPKQNEPPTEQDRLELFSDLGHQYEIATRALRKAATDSGRQDSNLPHGWMLRAALLRKFFMGRDNQVHLDKVAEAIGSVAQELGVFDEKYQTCCADVRDGFVSLPTTGTHIRNIGGPASGCYTTEKIFEQVTYGNVLHADYGKWRQTRANSAYMKALKGLVHSRESLLLDLIQPVDRLLGEGRGKVRGGAPGIRLYRDSSTE